MREKIWFAVGVLRNDDHICFERALDKQAGTFEFFVPPLQKVAFERLMNELVAAGVVLWFESQENPFSQGRG